MEDGSVTLFGHTLPAKTEHQWLLGLGLLGALGTVYLVYKGKQNASSAAVPSPTTGVVDSTSGSGATGSTGGTTTPPAPLPTIELKFSEDTSNAAEFQGSSNVAQGGGGHFSLLGLSFGGGGGGSNVKSSHVKTGVTNQVSVDTTITNATPAYLDQLTNFFTNLIGSNAQRNNANLQELQSGTGYLPNGTQLTPYVPAPGGSGATASPGGAGTGAPLHGVTS